MAYTGVHVFLDDSNLREALLLFQVNPSVSLEELKQ